MSNEVGQFRFFFLGFFFVGNNLEADRIRDCCHNFE
jgi:hypothetical protein